MSDITPLHPLSPLSTDVPEPALGTKSGLGTPGHETSSPPTAPATAPNGKKKKRSWGQRLKLTALVVVILALCFRVAVNLLLPTVLGKVAGTYGMECEYDRMNLSALGGNASIWGFALRPKGGGDAVLRADYLQGSIS